jgi:hypothetical protein
MAPTRKIDPNLSELVWSGIRLPVVFSTAMYKRLIQPRRIIALSVSMT